MKGKWIGIDEIQENINNNINIDKGSKEKDNKDSSQISSINGRC